MPLLLVCKAFTSEALDVFYTSNTFAIAGSELSVILDTSPGARHIRNMKLVDVEPVLDLHDQRSAEAALSSVNFVAGHFTSLHTVILPYTLGVHPNSQVCILQTTPQSPGWHATTFNPPSYDFQLILYSKSTETIWQEFTEAGFHPSQYTFKKTLPYLEGQYEVLSLEEVWDEDMDESDYGGPRWATQMTLGLYE